MAPTAAPANAIENLRKYAGIVVDAKSGEVLYEENADADRYPASVAKVMTLYILFQELEAGNLTLDTKMKVSRHAAAAVPTKLGLRAGSTISVEDAILSLVTLSANDMARVIAEHISGTESEFAERMTATAHALGMNETTYRNASGLPDGRQRTTVRDQAILGVAIYQHFPQYYDYFQVERWSYGGRTYGNHNNVLGYMGVVDGIKTGYINAAGSNLLTAARGNGRHIIVVAFGFNSGSSRDAKVRQLVKKYFDEGRRGDYLQTAMIPRPGSPNAGSTLVAHNRPVYVKPAPLPGFRLAELVADNAAQAAPTPQVVTASVAPFPAPMPADLTQQPAVQAATNLAATTEPPTPAYPAQDVIGAWLSETYKLGAPPTALGQTKPSAPLLPPVEVGIDPMTSGSIGDAANDNAPGSWIVQIGAGPTEEVARGLLSDATDKLEGLRDYRPYVERFDWNGQVFYRARFAGFGGRDAAAQACSQLKERDLTCLAMQS